MPKFEMLLGEEVHTRLVQEMKAIYEDADVPEFLDAAAKELLAQGRDAYRVNLRHGVSRVRSVSVIGSASFFITRK